MSGRRSALRWLGAMLRRLGRCATVANPALLRLLATEGRLVARAYLRHLVEDYHGRAFLSFAGDVPLLLPSVAPLTAFPCLDVPSVELLHPVQLPGGIRLEELFFLRALVAAEQPRRLVEIGTGSGRTTLNLIAAAPDDAVLTTFDLPEDAPTAAPDAGPDYRHYHLGRPGRAFEGSEFEPRIRQIRADSTTFDWTEFDGQIDFLFVDGAHDYASVRQDSQTALRIVRPGGLIVWHDYGHVQGVTQSLNELLSQQKVFWLAGTTLACLRRP